MDVWFLPKSRSNIQIENTRKTFLLWEQTDGYHHFDDEGIMRDRTNRYPSKIMFVEELIAPIGATQTIDKINNLVHSINLTKRSGGKVSISKIVTRFWNGLIKYFMYVFMVIIFIIALYFNGQPAVIP